MFGLRFLPNRIRSFVPFLVVIATATGTVFGQGALHNSSRECAICHIRWVDAFERADSENTPMDTVIERKAGSGDMCLSCHDGSVADSRFKVWSTRHHSTDVVPSSAVKIPTDKFPLDAQGRMTCATCHTAHAVPNSSDIETVVFLRQPNVDSSLCLACHPEHAQKNRFQHPLGRSDTPVPQEILDAGGQTSEDGHMIFCQTCHEPHGAQNAWMLVLPPAKLCITCHTAKAPEASPPAGAPVHRIGLTYPGFDPPQTLLDQKATFGAKGELDCLSCHRLHDASGAKPLLIRKNEDGSLCLECHEKEKSVIHSPHDLRFSSPETVNAIGQTPATSGVCGTCHRIHGWARNVQDTHVPHSSACVDCHKTGGPGSHNRPYTAAHPVGIPLPEDMTPALPLDKATRDIGCLTCHDPHTPLPGEFTTESTMHVDASDESPEKINNPKPELHFHEPRSFLRREGSKLCILCHDKISNSLTGPHDPNAFKPEIRQEFGMPKSIGACRVCHTSHNALGPHLWTQPATASEDPNAIDLCGACHDGGIVKAPHGTHHPIAIAHPKQDDTEPDVSGDIKTQPVIACIGCHDPHGESVPSAQLRYPVEDLCFKCHADKQDIKNSIHDPATNQWAKDIEFVSGGTCVDCHPMHGPESERGLRRLLSNQQGDAAQLCQACHQAEAPGKAVETPHINKVLSSTPKQPLENAPLNEKKRILCSTCHDIHQKTQNSSLLRAPRRDSVLCLCCHEDAGGLLNSAHDLRTSAPDVCNGRGETAAKSGPCGSCHTVHRTSSEVNAMANEDFGKSQCTSCHGAGENATARIPKYTDHPDVAMLNRIPLKDPTYMPIFDKQGEPSLCGAVSCLTCHQPHAAASGQASSGLMFLKQGTKQRLCADCHGIEALWRFLYYHKATRNPRAVKMESDLKITDIDK